MRVAWVNMVSSWRGGGHRSEHDDPVHLVPMSNIAKAAGRELTTAERQNLSFSLVDFMLNLFRFFECLPKERLSIEPVLEAAQASGFNDEEMLMAFVQQWNPVEAKIFWGCYQAMNL